MMSLFRGVLRSKQETPLFLQVTLLEELELNITLGSRKTEKKEYRVMIKKNENIYKLKTKLLTKGTERKEKNNYW